VALLHLAKYGTRFKSIIASQLNGGWLPIEAQTANSMNEKK
jgi:hypothetical protein